MQKDSTACFCFTGSQCVPFIAIPGIVSTRSSALTALSSQAAAARVRAIRYPSAKKVHENVLPLIHVMKLDNGCDFVQVTRLLMICVLQALHKKAKHRISSVTYYI